MPAAATHVSGVTVSPALTTAGATATYTIGFTTSASGALVPTSTITLTAPAGTVFPAQSGANYTVTNATVASVARNSVNGGTNNQAVLTLGVSTIGNSSAVTVTVSGVTNPVAGSYSTATTPFTVATSADTTPTGNAIAYVITGGGGGFIQQPAPIATTAPASGTATGSGTPTGTGTTPTPTPANFVVGALPANTFPFFESACGTILCAATFGAPGPGTFTVRTTTPGVTLHCLPAATNCVVNPDGSLTFTATAANQPLTWSTNVPPSTSSGRSSRSNGLAGKVRGLLAWLTQDAVFGAPADAATPVATFSVTGANGTLASNVPLYAGLSVSVAAGWNLMSGPSGSQLGGSAGSLYTFQASDSAYESFPTSTALSGGIGVWAYFPQAGLVTGLPSVTAKTQQIGLPASHFIMAGNPTDGAVTVSGADVVDVYNAATQRYTVTQGTAILQPGQGAWVFSRSGGTLTITPTGS